MLEVSKNEWDWRGIYINSITAWFPSKNSLVCHKRLDIVQNWVSKRYLRHNHDGSSAFIRIVNSPGYIL